MWLHGATPWLWAQDAPTSSGTDQLVILIGGIVVAAVTAGGTVLVAVVNARANRTAPSPPAPLIDAGEVRRRLDDGDEAREIIDRRLERHERTQDRFGDRLERIEDHLDRANPGWRHGPN